MRTINGESAALPGLLMTKTQVATLLGCSLRQVENLRRSGRIPQPIQLGPNSPRWRRPELLEVLGLAEPGVQS